MLIDRVSSETLTYMIMNPTLEYLHESLDSHVPRSVIH